MKLNKPAKEIIFQILTHFADGKDDMPLHDQSQSIDSFILRRWVAVPKSSDLQHRRDCKCSELPVQLKYSLVARGFGSKRLIVYNAHAFRGETVFPSVD